MRRATSSWVSTVSSVALRLWPYTAAPIASHATGSTTRLPRLPSRVLMLSTIEVAQALHARTASIRASHQPMRPATARREVTHSVRFASSLDIALAMVISHSAST